MTSLAATLVPDDLWTIVRPLLPLPLPPVGGRRRTIPDRNCFAAIVFMARASTPGACSQPSSWAAAHPQRRGGG
jgi:hypothetical protein